MNGFGTLPCGIPCSKSWLEFLGGRGLLRLPFEKAHTGGLKAPRGGGGGELAALQ